VKITAIRATPVNIPLEAPYHWSYGTFPGFSKAIIEIETDAGLVGLGEAPSPGCANIITHAMADRLIGRDPVDMAGCERAVLPYSRGVQSFTDFETIAAFGAIEMALWDLRGKAWDRPLYDLFGGAVRKQIPFTEYFAYREEVDGCGGEATIDDVVAYCVSMRDIHGSSFFEGKVSDPEPHRAIALVTALRKALGDDAMLRIDSNHAYSVTTAKQMAPAFEELRVRNWEDPVPTYEELAMLARHTSLSFSSHNLDLPKTVALGVPHAIVSGPAPLGGFTRLQRFIGACEAMGIDFWCYSGDAGIGTAAYLHLCAANAWIREPNQSLFRMQLFDVIEEAPFDLKNNLLAVPEGPGLGVTLSPDRLAHCHKLYMDEGPLDKYRDPFAPDQNRILPLA
jgi:glucarate dehydratase